ncbi:MAG: hypothetical protein ABW167_08895 [Baekduia sp.]
MVLLISYDLNGRERPSSYQKVKAFIEKNAQSSIRPLYSQWLVETTASPDAWTDAMLDAGIIDSNDRLFICEAAQPAQGWLDEGEWAWLRARMTTRV